MTDQLQEPQLTPEQELGLDFKLTPRQRKQYDTLRAQHEERLWRLQEDYIERRRTEVQDYQRSLFAFKTNVLEDQAENERRAES